ncbi:hypothetical protein [Lacinutrix jangbogonensis]|uniref:hypothetical protein n=1 Tax=Lacinutrix jangbogonensis TaxID=1469557 RepID=UPI00053ECF17|nr:hypothetical protein [Lacinutrix jangbogonensis]
MRVIVFYLVVFILIFSCKAAKERKQCIEFVNGKIALEINSFEELKTHITDVENYEDLLWVKDGLISSKQEVLILIENKNVLTIQSIKGANGKEGNSVIIITTNQCLEEIEQ